MTFGGLIFLAFMVWIIAKVLKAIGRHEVAKEKAVYEYEKQQHGEPFAILMKELRRK